MNWTRLMMLALLSLLLGISGCGMRSTHGGTGSFCRLYTPVPKVDRTSDEAYANEVTWCVLCRPDCPQTVVDSWKAQGGSVN